MRDWNQQGTIGENVARRQIARFVGRTAELGLFTRALDQQLDRNVLLVYGPGGVGKTTLLRAMQRIAEQAGRRTQWIADPMRDALVGDPVGAGAPAGGRYVTVAFVDGFDWMAAGVLRTEVLSRLPSGALVVIAGRGRPDSGWRRDGWEQIACELSLRELSHGESRQLLAAHGVPPTAAARICGWAAGSPLALTLAAGAYAVRGQVDPDLDLINSLVRVVTGAESDPAYFDALTVCAIARRTTVDLLRHTLPAGNEAEDAFAWLACRSFVDSYNDAVALHDVIRLPLREYFCSHRPEQERHLRRQICDYLYGRAVTGDRFAITELAHLVRNPVIRWGYSWDGSAQFHIDRVKPGDAEFIGSHLRQLGYAGWWTRSEPYFQHASQTVVIARDSTGRPVGYAICLTPATMPQAMLTSDPVGARCVEHANEINPSGAVLIYRDSIDLSQSLGITGNTVLSMLNVAVALRSDVTNPRHALVPAFTHNPHVRELCTAMGSRLVPELEWTFDAKRIGCYQLDYGPGGLYGAQRNLVYQELDLVPQQPVAPPSMDDVRAALEAFTSSTTLAGSSLAIGSGVEERANSVRNILRSAVKVVFGSSAHDDQLRAILTMRFLEGKQGHDAIARSLTISRATYFRRLREAIDRLGSYVISNGS